MPDLTQRVLFLKKLHLFRGLSDDKLLSVAREFVEMPPTVKTEEIVRQGETGDTLYLIYTGKVSVHVLEKGKAGIKTLATLIPGDYFGEESLLTRGKRSATIIAEPGTQLLKLDLISFKSLAKQFPQIRDNISVVVRSRRMARRLKFSWMQPDEIIYYLAGRHPFTLIGWVAYPLISILVLTFLASLVNGIYLKPWIVWFFMILLFINLIWFVWQWVDWSNDYYIVTSERVVRTEKIVALYDSREEAPLSTIISVNVNSAGFFQRWIGLGDVIVRTITTQITMYDVSYPNQVESMVQEYWNRSKEKNISMEREAIKKSIQLKLKPPPLKPIQETAEEKLKQESYATTIHQMLFANFLKVRFEDSNVVTYRKHWFVLVRDTFKQFVMVLILLSAPFLWADFIGNLLPSSGWLIWTVTLLFVLGWWIYDYVDWVNDVYKITPDQVIDIYKKPLGKEKRKSAQLENIMSTSSERKGIVGLLLNYGTVKIKIGVEVFDFTDVFDPPQVEQDIIRRMLLRRNKKAEVDRVAEAERMGNWLAGYHQISSELDNNDQL